MFFPSVSAIVITFLRDVSVIDYACALINPFNHGFKRYMNACIASSMAKSRQCHYYIINLGNVFLYGLSLL